MEPTIGSASGGAGVVPPATAAEIAELGAYPERERREGDDVVTARQLDGCAMSIPELLDWWCECRARMDAAL
jgi:hypothetical protein